MLNEPQNWSVSLSPSNTPYTLSLDRGAGTNTLQVFLFCLGASHPSAEGPWAVSEHPPGCISFRSNSSALIQERLHFSLRRVPCYICGVLGPGCPVGDECQGHSPALPGVGAAPAWIQLQEPSGPGAPSLPPSCAAALAAPLALM